MGGIVGSDSTGSVGTLGNSGVVSGGMVGSDTTVSSGMSGSEMLGMFAEGSVCSEKIEGVVGAHPASRRKHRRKAVIRLKLLTSTI